MSARIRFSPVALLGIVLALGPGGCGPSGEKGLTPVQGRVTLDGGPWPAPGQITFVPGAVGDKAVPSTTAAFDAAGNFTAAGGYGGGAGLHPGTYRASVQCIEGEADMPLPGKKDATRDVVPARYRDAATSGLEFKVEGRPVEVTFDVKSK